MTGAIDTWPQQPVQLPMPGCQEHIEHGSHRLSVSFGQARPAGLHKYRRPHSRQHAGHHGREPGSLAVNCLQQVLQLLRGLAVPHEPCWLLKGCSGQVLNHLTVTVVGLKASTTGDLHEVCIV